ncbi:MAG: GTPase RsgA [Saprospiraceae bacterium]
MNNIAPDLSLRTHELSGYSGKGQHTTTFAEMFQLPFGGNIIDTPGIKTLSFNHFEPMDVAHNSASFSNVQKIANLVAPASTEVNPAVPVKAALEAEEVSELRYLNYITLLEEVEGQNYWERHKSMGLISWSLLAIGCWLFVNRRLKRFIEHFQSLNCSGLC